MRTRRRQIWSAFGHATDAGPLHGSAGQSHGRAGDASTRLTRSRNNAKTPNAKRTNANAAHPTALNGNRDWAVVVLFHESEDVRSVDQSPSSQTPQLRIRSRIIVGNGVH